MPDIQATSTMPSDSSNARPNASPKKQQKPRKASNMTLAADGNGPPLTTTAPKQKKNTLRTTQTAQNTDQQNLSVPVPSANASDISDAQTSGCERDPQAAPRSSRKKKSQQKADAPKTPRTNSTSKRVPAEQVPRTTITPSKSVIPAYAGPTFHASPAPSSLPIPKFFSKSAPANDAPNGLMARMQEESQEQSSGTEESPDSPSIASAGQPQSQHPQVAPSPLDFLLNADREEKARKASMTLSPPQPQNARPYSTSPSHSTQRPQRPHHVRTHTAGSIFSMDGESSSGIDNRQSYYSRPQSALTPIVAPRPVNRANSPPNTEQQRLKNESLRRMLFPPTPQAQQSDPNRPSTDTFTPNSMSSPGQRIANGPRSNSSYSTPYSSQNNTPASSIGYTGPRPQSFSPYTQNSPSPKIHRTLCPQPSPSLHQLRQEIPFNPTAHVNGHSNTNSESRPRSNLYRFPDTRGAASPFSATSGHNTPNRNPSPNANAVARRFTPEDALRTAGAQPSSVDMMEEQLRQILKLDRLQTQRASSSHEGVRS